jgi:hypothetical protein
MPLTRVAHVCAAVLVLVSPAGAQHDQSHGAIAGKSAGPASSPAENVATEQEWIVRNVTTAVRQMVAYATRSKVGDGAAVVKTTPRSDGSIAFNVQPLAGTPLIISISDHIWAPGAYVPLASSLAKSAIETCTANATAPVVAALLDPRVSTIVHESARISERLKTNMRCADAHNEAALLLGAFALREGAGAFSDTRGVLSRMSAHLALADTVERGVERTVVRQLADAVLLTLIGRQRSAMAALDRIEAGRPVAEVRVWLRALRVRNTSDWRIIPEKDTATLFEQLALARAYKTSLGSSPTLDFFDTIQNPAEVVDWARILLQNNPNVEAGNRFTAHWIAAELTEALEVRSALRPGTKIADRHAMTRELNVEPSASAIAPDGTIAVIDWGMWAGATQRHLLAAVTARNRHLANSLGLPAAARAFRKDVLPVISGLQLYPLAAVALASSRDEAERAFASIGTLVHTRPELVTNGVWRILQSSAKWAVVPMPDARQWFTPVLPAGTVFDVDNRSQRDGKQPRFTSQQIAELRQQAPFSRRLAQEAVHSHGEKPPYDVVRNEYAVLAPYDFEITTALARSAWDRPEVYISHMEAACRMSADAYWDLAPYLADHGRIPEARRAYETWLTSGRNQVSISNSMHWLVRHYFETGEHDRAVGVAERVADVGSYRGLITRANLHDWYDEREEAERVFRQAWQRYDNPNDLLAFYLRHGRKGPEVDELMRKVFPTGLTRPATLPDMIPPRDGVLIEFPGKLGSELGMREDDVVIAVDGIRVRNLAQYRVAAGASTDETMRLTVWRGGKYIDIGAQLRYRWIVSRMKTYQSTAAADR